MLHPVGDLPAGVYWRRRALVAAMTLSVVGGGGWLALSAGAASAPDTQVASSTTNAAPSLEAPSLEQVVPSLAAVQTPAEAAPATFDAVPITEPTSPPVDATSGLTPGQACTDDMIAVDVVPAAPQAAVGSKPTFTLVVTNTSPVACTRSVDAGLREVVLLDAAGTRVWGSNDCFPERSSDPRTLAVGEAVSFPVQWGGLTSEPTCTVTRVNPPAGAYQLQGRLDTKVGNATPFTLT